MQLSAPRPLRVAVFNDDKDTLSTIARWLERHGHRAVTGCLAHMRQVHENLERMVRDHHTHVVVFHVQLPFGPGWDFVSMLREYPGLSSVPFLITTPDKAALDRTVGATDAIQFAGTPEDLAELLRRVEAASRRGDGAWPSVGTPVSS